MNTQSPVISWRTRKTDAGFIGVVIAISHEHTNTLHESRPIKTRARARSWAKAWMIYAKRRQRENLNRLKSDNKETI